MPFGEFLAWAATAAGIQAIIGFIGSWVLDQWGAWAEMSPFRRRLWMFVLSLAVPLLASLVGVLTGYSDGTIEQTWWPSVEAGLTAFAASQARHMLTLSRAKRAA